MATRKRSSAKSAPLAEYKAKRDFSKTDEPAGGAVPRAKGPRLRFVIQKHAASHLHFDFRLELDGVMKAGPCRKARATIRASNGSRWRWKTIRSNTTSSKERFRKVNTAAAR